jgi:HEAT repeat protein
MRDKSGKGTTQKHKNIFASIVYTLLSAGLVIFIFGCEDSSQSTLGDFYVTNVASPEAEATRIIQSALADMNPLVRVNAVEVVATTRQVRLMPKVQRLWQDEFTPVRFAVALAIGDLEYSLAKNSASRLLKDEDVNVVIAASYAMGKLGSTEYFEVIRKAINSDDQTVRANAVFLLGKTGDKSVLKLLKWAQEDKDSSDKVRFQVLEARARLGDEEVLQRLWAIVYSAFADDRIMGIRAMGLLATSKARDIIVTKLDDNVLEVRLTAAEQLGKLRDRIGESEVLAVFDKNLTNGLDKQAIERANVLTALAIGQICTPSLEKFLPQLLKNESQFVRIAAAKAVFQCKMK